MPGPAPPPLELREARRRPRSASGYAEGAPCLVQHRGRWSCVKRVDHHPVPAGPLAVRWLAYDLGDPRAGAVGLARVVLENAGSATWRADGPHRIEASYHWLDDRGNPIVWEGYWRPLDAPVPPGERVELPMEVRAPLPPGRYRLAFDLVEDGRWWFAELGNTPMEVEVEVAPRIRRRALAARVRPGPPGLEEETGRALAAQEEPLLPEGEAEAVAHLAAGCLPAPDWSRRVLDAHEEGYAAVGGSIEPLGGPLARRRDRAALAPWRPGTGRNPAFAHPLLCPSLLAGVEPSWEPDVEGLPALAPPDEPWLYDGRIAIRARLPAGRRRG